VRERCRGEGDMAWTLGTGSKSLFDSNLWHMKVTMNPEGGSLFFQHPQESKVQSTGKQFICV
jgi:hypothetical protein